MYKTLLASIFNLFHEQLDFITFVLTILLLEMKHFLLTFLTFKSKDEKNLEHTNHKMDLFLST